MTDDLKTISEETSAPDISKSPVNVVKLREEWGLSPNGLKNRAKALGIELIRKGNATYWPADQLNKGHALHNWLKEGHPLKAFIEEMHAKAGNGSALTRKRRSSAALVTAESRREALGADPLAFAKRLKDAADLGVPLRNEEMAAVLGLASVGKDRDGTSPRPGFTIHRMEHNGTPFWTVARIGSLPVSDASVPAAAPQPEAPRQWEPFSGNIAAQMTIDVATVDCTGSSLFTQNLIG